jgi:Galactosyltransferase
MKIGRWSFRAARSLVSSDSSAIVSQGGCEAASPLSRHWLCAPLGTAIPPRMQAVGHELRTQLGVDPGNCSALLARRAFSEHFFLRWLDASAPDELPCIASSHDLIAAIQCESTLSEFQHFLLTCYAAAFRHSYAAEIRAFLRSNAAADVLVVHISCHPYVARARQSVDTFRDSYGRIRNIVVVGAPGGGYSFDAVAETLLVPAGDHYENLPSKVAAAFHFIGMAGYTGIIVKVDDDIRCNDAEALGDAVLDVTSRADYSGKVFDPTILPGISRTWHIAKCASPAFNDRPFSGIPHAAYAEGPVYVLSSNALHALSKAWLMFSDHFTESLYEDLSIGEVLAHFGIYPLSYDLRRSGLVHDTAGPPTAAAAAEGGRCRASVNGG